MANDVLIASLSPVIEIASGKIRGTVAGGIHAFKGIPYGASTSGTNRFLQPQPVAPWAGTRDALAYHGQAPQSPAKPKRRGEMDNILGPADGTPEVEDCLTLNVWTPDAAGKRPVMVWLHGGAFAYRDALQQIAADMRVPLVRRYDLMHQWLANGLVQPADLLYSDGLHMTDGGYALLATEVGKEIMALTGAAKPSLGATLLSGSGK